MTTTDDYTDDRAREMGVEPTDPRWIEYVAEQRRIDANAPTVIPPCPRWCTLPAGHEYTGVCPTSLTWDRMHTAFQGTGCDVSAMEHNCHGLVTLDAPVIYIDVAYGDCSTEQVRAFADELRHAADVVDRLSDWPSDQLDAITQ